MDTRKRNRLEAAGWRVGSAAGFLGLSAAEAAVVEMRLALSELFRTVRVKSGLTQNIVAKRLRSSQSRVAKMEAGDPTVSLELLIRALLVVGASRRAISPRISPGWEGAALQRRDAAGRKRTCGRCSKSARCCNTRLNTS